MPERYVGLMGLPRRCSRWLPPAATVLAAVVVVAACANGGDDSSATSATTPTTRGGQSTQPGGTSTTAAPLPVPRTEVAGARWGGRLAVAGGLTADGTASRRFDLYDPGNDTWTRGPDLPVALHHTALAVLDGRLHVIGGYSTRGRRWMPEEAVYSLGDGEDTWRRAPPLRIARGALAAAATDDRIIVGGGVNRRGEVLASTELLRSEAGSWTAGPALGEGREHLAVAAVGTEVYAIGGRVGGLERNLASVEVLRGDQWDAAGTLERPRGGIGAAAMQDRPCVAGGEEPAGTIAEIECLDRGRWTVVASLDVARHGLAVLALNERLHAIGGGPQPGLTVSDTHEIIDL